MCGYSCTNNNRTTHPLISNALDAVFIALLEILRKKYRRQNKIHTNAKSGSTFYENDMNETKIVIQAHTCFSFKAEPESGAHKN